MKDGSGKGHSDHPDSKNPVSDHPDSKNPVLDHPVSKYPVLDHPVPKNPDVWKEEYVKAEDEAHKQKEEKKNMNFKVEKLELVILKGIQCSECSFMATDQSLLNDHKLQKHFKKREKRVENKTKGRKTICHICKEAITSYYLERHHKTVHNRRAKALPCSVCEESFFDYWSRKRHFEEVHGGKYFCQTC